MESDGTNWEESQKDIILESWNLGILESWNLGILESWNLEENLIEPEVDPTSCYLLIPFKNLQESPRISKNLQESPRIFINWSESWGIKKKKEFRELELESDGSDYEESQTEIILECWNLGENPGVDPTSCSLLVSFHLIWFDFILVAAAVVG